MPYFCIALVNSALNKVNNAEKKNVRKTKKNNNLMGILEKNPGWKDIHLVAVTVVEKQ